MNNYYLYNDELYHHGVKGMKWGVLRSRTAVLYDKNPGHKAESKNPSSNNPYEGEVYKKTLKGNLHRLAAANYKLNAKTYKKLGNKTLVSMNENAYKNSIKKAKAADKAVAIKRSKKGGSDSTKAKINNRSKDSNQDNKSIKEKFNDWAAKEARKNVSRSLAFQKKHKVGAYGKLSAAYHKRKGHTYRDPKTGKIVKPNK